MSDMFDHMVEAYESMDTDEGGFFSETNPLFYHTFITFIEILIETPKAYQLKTKLGTFWVAKSLCRCINLRDRTVYIHKKSYLQKMREISKSQ